MLRECLINPKGNKRIIINHLCLTINKNPDVRECITLFSLSNSQN